MALSSKFPHLSFPPEYVSLLELRGRQIEVAIFGSGSPMVVLEAGLSDDFTSWVPICAELARRSTILAYSRPGYGRSSSVDTPRGLAVQACELRAMLAGFGFTTPYILVGHSWGGLLVQACAARFPEDVAGLVTIDAPAPDHVEILARSKDGDAFRDANVNLSGVAIRELNSLSAPGGGHVPWEHELYGGPTVIMTAIESKFGSAEHKQRRLSLAAAAAARYRQADIRKIACGHYIHHERPFAVLDAVDTILERARLSTASRPKSLQRSSANAAVFQTVALEERLSAEVQQFRAEDVAVFPDAGQVLFVGSSSIRLWRTLAEDMAPLRTINRGFGSSHIEHVNRWFSELVARYGPSAIVFYAGDNDIAAGKTVERVVSDFSEFMALKTSALGPTPVYFISLKPTSARFAQFALQSQVNEAVRDLANDRGDLHFIDIVSAMLDEAGEPKREMETDGLHMVPEGYAIWTRAVKEFLGRNILGDWRKLRGVSFSVSTCRLWT
jgi:lysophospholipase L1-like esterase